MQVPSTSHISYKYRKDLSYRPSEMADQHAHDDTLDRLKVMIHQEEHLYSCPDYFAPDYRTNNIGVKQSIATPLHVIEECAKLVTDLSFADSNPKKQEMVSPHDVRSTGRADSNKSSEPVTLPKVSPELHLIPSWRSQMCSWAYTVVDTFGFSRTTVAICFDLLDRYLAKECRREISLSRQDFQLLSMTSLYLAVKLHGSGEKLGIETLMDMSRGYFAMEDFEDAELDMLEALEWRLSPPTADCFLMEFHTLYPTGISSEWMSSCQELLELSVADAYFVPRKDSQLALAAMLVTAKKFNVLQEQLDMFCDIVQNVVDVKDEHFVGIYAHLEDVISQ